MTRPFVAIGLDMENVVTSRCIRESRTGVDNAPAEFDM